ncbi:lamin tail domain-containing protein [Halostella sp. PRR32]|uniref:lamin tail domain-containing protein n=1 Tax=Halostella sp. PRR32 TaxID=3098147 RepID=UPI002B1E2626|nr:lamin tail domain-containing protein [Halostella sp. PRR32]
MYRLGTVLMVVLVVLSGCVGATGGDGGPTESNVTTSELTPTASPDGSGNGTLELHFINVGQGAATLVVGPSGETMLVDTGHWTDDGDRVLRYLRQRGIHRIDYLVTTHADADHIGGHAAVIEHYETKANGVGAVYDPGIAASTATYDEYLSAVEKHDVTLYETREGDSIPMEGIAIDVLGPPEKRLDDGARNENNVVLRLRHGSVSALLPGDAEHVQEAHLVDTYGVELNATVLAAGHHGSKTSTGDELLTAVSPEMVVVSSAYDSPYGHPHNETLRRLADSLIPTYWTGGHGDVVVISGGDAVSVRTQQSAVTQPLRLRDVSPVAPENGTAPVTRATISAGGPADDAPASTVVADGGADLRIAAVHQDAAGDDYENLNGEYVTLENAGDDDVELSGWTLSDESGETYTVPDGVSLAPGESVTIYSGNGTDTGTDLYWEAGRPIWNNGGDTVTVRNDRGELVVQETYG